ncbi:MAG TPA: hypothetical protein VFS67_14905 [Polyangiaceae bacterium]|nr:hypothetical protein [Polyangiaceae bacterium]
MRLWVALLSCVPLLTGCAHVEADEAPPAAPAAGAAGPPPPGAPASAPPQAPQPTLQITSAPIEALRSPFFSALEVTFQNPSGQWHQVRKVSISPERQLFGPAIETLVGDRLRAWQLAEREARMGLKDPHHPALDTLAPDPPPAAGAPKPESDAAASALPPNYLLASPFTIAPGLFTRKWIVLYSAAPDALLGQELVLSYELEDAKVERVLVKYPKPEPKKD